MITGILVEINYAYRHTGDKHPEKKRKNNYKTFGDVDQTSFLWFLDLAILAKPLVGQFHFYLELGLLILDNTL